LGFGFGLALQRVLLWLYLLWLYFGSTNTY
jgi:hypothetical protein